MPGSQNPIYRLKSFVYYHQTHAPAVLSSSVARSGTAVYGLLTGNAAWISRKYRLDAIPHLKLRDSACMEYVMKRDTVPTELNSRSNVGFENNNDIYLTCWVKALLC